MVVWSVHKVLDADVRAKDDSRDYLDEATWDQAGATREWVTS